MKAESSRKASRLSRYMISPADGATADKQLAKLLQDFGGIDVLRTMTGGGPACAPVAAVRAAPETIAALRSSTRGALVIELDELLRAASPRLSARLPAPPVMTAMGTGFNTTVKVQSEQGEPVQGAEVHVQGQQWWAHGVTGSGGEAELTLFGESPETVLQLLVKPRAGYWGLWIAEPDLKPDTVNALNLRSLPKPEDRGWAAQAMGFDRLPAEWRGAGVRIALIDSGAAGGHHDLQRLERGFDTAGGESARWLEDPMGHGTLGAGILAAAGDAPGSFRGFAPDAEIHVCKLGPAARCSDLVAALDYCIDNGIDTGCIGFGCEERSVIAGQRILAAKQRGIALFAAAGSTGGPVQFPASSPHVLAVGAIGKLGTFPDNSPHAAHAQGAAFSGDFFVPAFSCAGPEAGLSAPGVGVISCQSPNGYAAADGTSVAVCHAAALAALVLAHRAEFQREFSNKDSRRVEWLFQVLKQSARALGHPAQTGAGLPDASRAVGMPMLSTPAFTPLGLSELRRAMQAARLAPQKPGEPDELGEAGGAQIRGLKAAMRLSGLA